MLALMRHYACATARYALPRRNAAAAIHAAPFSADAVYTERHHVTFDAMPP